MLGACSTGRSLTILSGQRVTTSGLDCMNGIQMAHRKEHSEATLTRPLKPLEACISSWQMRSKPKRVRDCLQLLTLTTEKNLCPEDTGLRLSAAVVKCFQAVAQCQQQRVHLSSGGRQGICSPQTLQQCFELALFIIASSMNQWSNCPSTFLTGCCSVASAYGFYPDNGFFLHCRMWYDCCSPDALQAT